MRNKGVLFALCVYGMCVCVVYKYVYVVYVCLYVVCVCVVCVCLSLETGGQHQGPSSITLNLTFVSKTFLHFYCAAGGGAVPGHTQDWDLVWLRTTFGTLSSPSTMWS